jgi:hypothetical protein
VGVELRKHRAIVTAYNETLRGLRQEIAAARDAVGGTAQAAGDADLRHQYQGLLDQERALLGQAGGAPSPGEASEMARGAALLDRLDRTEAAAGQLKAGFASVARRNAVAVGAWVAAERASLLHEQDQLASINGESRDLIGRIAFRSFSAVRAQFYRLVLKADVGIVDVAWSRKRERVERIQQISQQKTAELDALDRDYRLLLREVE